MASSLRPPLPDVTITIVGLGPAGIGHVDAGAWELLDEAETVVVRTLNHPAAQQLAARRAVLPCDDLYDGLDGFDDIYTAIAERVVAAAAKGSVVYAVPGSAVVGERAVAKVRLLAREAGIDVTVRPGLSFLDLAYIAVGVDPIADGLQVLDARDLPDPLPLHLPTFVTQVDSKLRSSDVSLALTRTIGPETEVTVLDRLGDDDEVVTTMRVSEVARYDAGPRTTVYVPATSSGLMGLIDVHRILRRECPWDRAQTHHTLVTHLIEEAYETADAIGHLPPDAPGGEPDFGAYAEVEDELGDLLLQVVFHATLASEAGAFDIDEVAEGVRRKLVQRHPHVFGDVEVADADEVLSNWEQIKKVEKSRESLMDDIPIGMPGVARAMKVQKRARSVGFDWEGADEVMTALKDEIDELIAAGDDKAAAREELGDVLFTVVNLSRHLGIDPEVALRASVDKFIARFKSMEREFASRSMDMVDASTAELEAAWLSAKSISPAQSTWRSDPPSTLGAS
ncbi:MAG: nucleoside triphosphate pyrophosphohydrolase [Actinomycetota bacterium]|nr:nucleoside triphosphate pyrophosphohydrolase [Actinomycetota bacterium]